MPQPDEQIADIDRRVGDIERRLNGYDFGRFHRALYGEDENKNDGLIDQVSQLSGDLQLYSELLRTWSERLKTAIWMLRIIAILFSVGFLGWLGQLGDAIGALLEGLAG